MSEERLWRAVIIQAILDASHVSNAPPNEVSKIRNDARKFLFKGGKDFELVCDLAGFHHETVQRRAKEYIDSSVVLKCRMHPKGKRGKVWRVREL